MKGFLRNLKYVKCYDVFSVFIFLLLVVPALLYKIYLKIIRRRVWLITEEGHYARDNGYYFYKYAVQQNDKIRKYYVIDKKSHDYEKVKDLGNVIQFRSPKHWIYYLSSEYNISSQKNGNPAQALFYVLHVKLNLFNNRVFLQHGITHNKSDWILYNNTKFKYFICGADREYQYIKNNYGYPKGSVVNLGFPRFDSLIDESCGKKQILIMPTWRNWLGRETNGLTNRECFEQSKYFKNWNGLLNDPSFIDFVEKNGINVKFYPHAHMQKFLGSFSSKSKNIEILSTSSDIQSAMRDSSILITDYSSVAMDFAYMRKPIIYFQFDVDEYRKKQLQRGYFDYASDGFGPIVKTKGDLVELLSQSYRKHSFVNDAKYSKRADSFFGKSDADNSKRTYMHLKNRQRTNVVSAAKSLLLFLSFLSCGMNILTIEIKGFSVPPIMIMGAAIAVFRLLTRDFKRPRLSFIEISLLSLLVFSGVNLAFSYDIWRGVKVFGKISLLAFSVWEMRCLAYSMGRQKIEKAFALASVVFLLSTAAYYICGLASLGLSFNTPNTRVAGVMIDRKTPRLISLASSDPNITAIFLSIPLIFYMRKRMNVKYFIIVAGFTLLSALTMSRGATVAIVCLLAAFVLFGQKRLMDRFVLAASILVVFIMSSVAIDCFINASDKYAVDARSQYLVAAKNNDSDIPTGARNTPPANSTSADKSIAGRLLKSLADNGSGRLTLWKRTIAFYKERPINGIGIGNLYTQMGARHKYNKYAHNTYLEMMAENGSIGIVLFSIFIVALIVSAFRLRKSNDSLLLALSFMLPAIVFLSVFHHEVFYVVLLYMAVAYDDYRERNRDIKVSVLMPTLNTSKAHLVVAIRSILEQTHTNFELIIVADGGNDAGIVADEFEDERITIIRHNHSKGIANSLNEAMAVSTGKYLVRMDADDIAKQNRIEKQVAYMENHPAITIAASFVRKFDGADILACETCTKPSDVYSKSFFISPLIHPSVIMRASTVRNGSLDYCSRYERAEDYELWCRAMERGYKIAIMRYYGLRYRVHSGQISAAKRDEQSKVLTSIYSKHLTDLHLPQSNRKYLFILSGREKLESKDTLKRFVNEAIRQNNRYKKYSKRSFRRVMRASYAASCFKNKLPAAPNPAFINMCFKKLCYKLPGLLIAKDDTK